MEIMQPVVLGAVIKHGTLNKFIMITKADFLSPGIWRETRAKWKYYAFIMLLIFICVTTIHAQERMVQGRVVSDAGDPLIGVSVLVKGTDRSTSTTDNGRFSIEANSGEI